MFLYYLTKRWKFIYFWDIMVKREIININLTFGIRQYEWYKKSWKK